MTKRTGRDFLAALCTGQPGGGSGLLARRLAVALLGAALLAVLFSGCGGSEGVAVAAGEEGGGLAAPETLPAETAGETKDDSADKATLYNWAKSRYPLLRGYSTGLINGNVSAEINYKQNAASGYFNCKYFSLQLDQADRVRPKAFQMYATAGTPCVMTVSTGGVATVTGSAYLCYYGDPQSTRVVEYKLVLTDRGNRQSPRDNVKVYYRTGSSAWVLAASFDCTYQSATGGDLIVKRRTASAW